jgi:VCBS repeat-containing protein
VTDSYLLGITVSDGLHVSAIETIEIQVSDQNEPPTDIALDNVTVMENAAGAVIGNLSITDPDDGDSHDYEVSDNRFKIAGTQLRLRAGHQLDRETEPTVQLGITVTDRNGAGLAYHESFTLTVQDVNEAPIAGSDLYQVTAGTSLIISPSGVLADDIDPEGEALTAVLVAGPTYGTLTLRADGSFNYTPDANFTGRDMFIYLASDGLRASAATQVTINVRPAFLPPPNPAPSPAPTPVSGTDPSTDPAPEPQPAPTPPPPPSTGENDSDDESDKDKIVTVPPVGAGASQASTDRVLTPPPAEIIAASEEEQSASLTMLVESYRQASEGGGVERAIAGDTVRSAATGLFDDDFSVDTSGNIDYALMAAPGEMWNELDERVQQVESRIQGDLIVVGTAGAAASSLTVGLVAWALRTGFLASGLLAQMPAWRSFDPLLVMQGLGESGDEETLEDFVNREIESLDNVEQPETAIELERTQPFATNHSTGQL